MLDPAGAPGGGDDTAAVGSARFTADTAAAHGLAPDDAAQVAQLIRDGARVMVCGGRDMAAGVANALADILAPTGLTPAVLKTEGRYVEDVY